VKGEREDALREEIEKAIKGFVNTSPSNRLKGSDEQYFAEPMVGYADIHDPLFAEYKNIIGDFHLTPAEFLEAEYGGACPESGTVISWILPVATGVRRSNRKGKKVPSLEWSHMRFFGELFNEALRKYVVALLSSRGYRTLAPALTAQWKRIVSPEVGHASTWSERHAAYAAGLGTFSLSDALITRKGIAHRIGSVITELVLEPTARPYQDPYDYCLKYNSGTCGACIGRCPAGAITEKGHDKEACSRFMNQVISPKVNEAYGVTISGCGLCQTKVPCESKVPVKTPVSR